jgi:hypothetical protein
MGSKRIAQEPGVSRGAVKRHLAAGGWQPFSGRRCVASGSTARMIGCASGFAGTAAPPTRCGQELAAEKGIAPSLRTVERALKPRRPPLAGLPPFRPCRTLVRRVKNECVVEVDGNACSVLWRLIGETVEVVVAAGQVRVRSRIAVATTASPNALPHSATLRSEAISMAPFS